MEPIFENTETSFALKSNLELNRARFLFELLRKKPLVRIASAFTNLALKSGIPVESIIRYTVFDHFCGGINEEDCLEIIDKMSTKNVCSVLDYSSEGKLDEDKFNFAMEKTLQTLEYAKSNKSIPFVVFKPTGLGSFKIYQKLTETGSLNSSEQVEWARIRNRFETICSRAQEYGIRVLIDAEESWMQDAADELVEEMMEKYNKTDVIVFNTLQCYRWDRKYYLIKLRDKSKEKGFKIGIKLVRGAYMEKERKRAEENNYKDPICIDKRATDELYNGVLNYILNDLDSIELFAGTHNEESSYRLMQLMKEKAIPENDRRVWFGQLYGMSDHISYNLSKVGYNVAKYLPYGPVRDVLPYLIRRAEENTSVEGQTSRELFLLKKEIKRRKN